MNMDSLMLALSDSTHYMASDKMKFFEDPYKQFESSTSNEVYEVYLDSTGQLTTIIGLAVVYREYDESDRIIKRIGYNLEGGYYLWDYPPIIITHYGERSKSEDNYGYNNQLRSRTTTIIDSVDRLIRTLNYDSDLQLTSMQTKDYLDSKNEVWVKFYDGAGHLRPNQRGMSIHLQRLDPANPEFVVAEYFYDSNKNLVDADHCHLFSNDRESLIYSRISRETRDGVIVTSFFNSKGRKICEDDLVTGEMVIFHY